METSVNIAKAENLKTKHDPFVQFVELLAKINNREQIIQKCDEQDENPEETTHN